MTDSNLHTPEEQEKTPTLEQRFALKEKIARLRRALGEGEDCSDAFWPSDVEAVLEEIDRLMFVDGQIAKLWADAEDRADSPTPLIGRHTENMTEKSTEVLSGENQEDVRLMPHLSTTTSTAPATTRTGEIREQLISVCALDVGIAEQVMGWYIGYDGLNYRWTDSSGAHPRYITDWKPATSVADAWLVLEQLERDQRHILSEITRRMSTFGTHFIYAVVLRQCTSPFPPNWWSEEASAPLAICVAALKAVEAK